MARLMEVMLAVRAGETEVLSVPPEEAVVEGTKVEKAAGVTRATGLGLVGLEYLGGWMRQEKWMTYFRRQA